MKIVIVSDIHANFDALAALEESYDELWVLGDLVNYGPEPAPVIDYVRSRAAVIVRGNHDHSIGFHEDPRCSPRFRDMAEATRRFTESVLSFSDKQFLRNLPLQIEVRRDNTRFYLCHATPSDPLFGYCQVDSPRWLTEVKSIAADVVPVGHTHVPALRPLGHCQVVNPGSLGQPKTGSSKARYAVWENGRLELKSYPYPVEGAVAKIQALPIDAARRDELSVILRTGDIPPANRAG
jgi:putative phosphoesterase